MITSKCNKCGNIGTCLCNGLINSKSQALAKEIKTFISINKCFIIGRGDIFVVNAQENKVNIGETVVIDKSRYRVKGIESQGAIKEGDRIGLLVSKIMKGRCNNCDYQECSCEKSRAKELKTEKYLLTQENINQLQQLLLEKSGYSFEKTLNDWEETLEVVEDKKSVYYKVEEYNDTCSCGRGYKVLGEHYCEKCLSNNPLWCM